MLTTQPKIELTAETPGVDALAVQTAANILRTCRTRTPADPTAPLLRDSVQEIFIEYSPWLADNEAAALLAQVQLLHNIVQLYLNSRAAVKPSSVDLLRRSREARRLVTDALAAYQAYLAHEWGLYLASQVERYGPHMAGLKPHQERTAVDWTEHNQAFLALGR